MFSHKSIMIKHQHSFDDKLDVARNLEREGDAEKAEKIYRDIIAKEPTVYAAYDRLMVIYRKQKNYSKELSTVNKALKAFQANIISSQKEWIKENRVAARLSKSLAVSLGVLDKKGMPVNDDPQLVKWKKRKEVISKRLKKA